MRALLLGVVVLWGCQASAPPRCALGGTPLVVLEEGAANAPGSRRLALWEVSDDPRLWGTARPASPSLEAFRREAEVRAGDVTPTTLLRLAQSRATSEREAELNRALLAEVDRRVVPMRCFDAFFLARQTERLDMIRSPSEVLAFVLRSADGTRLRIIEYTVNQAGIGRVGPVREQLDAAVAAGWRAWAAFHNHNFFFEESGWHGGSVAPSAPDAELLGHLRDDLGLEESWITNGFSTSLWPTRDLPP
jgi:hypothetical protein